MLRAAAREATIDGEVWAFNAPSLVVIPARAVHGFRFCEDIDGHVITTAQSAIESVALTAAPDLLDFVRTPAVLTVDVAHRRGVRLETLLTRLDGKRRTASDGNTPPGWRSLSRYLCRSRV